MTYNSFSISARGQGVSVGYVVGHAFTFSIACFLYTRQYFFALPEIVLGTLSSALLGSALCLRLPEILNRSVRSQSSIEFS